MLVETDLFSRQVAHQGQEKLDVLAGSTVLVAGIGGVGCTVAEILARCGVGRLVIVDNNVVDLPDLARQALYDLGDLGRPKVHAASEKLLSLNGVVKVLPLELTIGEVDLTPYLLDSNCVVDCLDNFSSRFALEDALNHGRVLVHGAMSAGYGHVTSVVKGESVSLRELYAGISQPTSPVPASAPIVYCLASVIAQEVMNILWGLPRLQGKMFITHMDGLVFLEEDLG